MPKNNKSPDIDILKHFLYLQKFVVWNDTYERVFFFY